jgi:hypothetical protein
VVTQGARGVFAKLGIGSGNRNGGERSVARFFRFKALNNDPEYDRIGVRNTLSEDKIAGSLQDIIKGRGEVSPKFKAFLITLIYAGVKEETIKKIVEIRRKLVDILSAETPEARERKAKGILPTEKQKNDDWLMTEARVDDVLIDGLVPLIIRGTEEIKIANILKLNVETILAEKDASENDKLKGELTKGLTEIANLIKEGVKVLSEKERKKFIQELENSIKKDTQRGFIYEGKEQVWIDELAEQLMREDPTLDPDEAYSLAIEKLVEQGKIKHLENCFITNIQDKELRKRVIEKTDKVKDKELNWYLLEKIYNDALRELVEEGIITKEKAEKLGPITLLKTNLQELERVIRTKGEVRDLRILYPMKDGRNHAVKIWKTRIDREGNIYIKIIERNIDRIGTGEREVKLSEFVKELKEIKIIAHKKYTEVFKEYSNEEKKAIKKPYGRGTSSNSTETVKDNEQIPHQNKNPLLSTHINTKI